ERCRPVRFSDAVRYCMPETAGGTTVFTNDSCTSVLGHGESGIEPPRYFIRHYELAAGQEAPSRLYRSGPRVAAPAQVWRQSGIYCLGPYPVDPGAYYEL